MDRAMDWVFAHSKSTRGARFVLSYLALTCNERGLVAQTINYIADDVHLARQSVSNAVKRLVKLGDIVPVQKNGRSWVYRLACFNEAGEFIGAGADCKEVA